jgi:N utilization substance protein B
VRIRRLGREQALSLLFQVDVGGLPYARVLEVNEREREVPPEAWNFAVELTRGTLSHLAEIDRVINDLAIDWTVDRMASMDRAILRLATYELLYRPDIPPSVSINEAVELAKRYGTEESSRFVNGILGHLARRLEADGE